MRNASNPLQGMRVLITRPKEQSKPLSEEVTKLGGTPLEFPTISIEPLTDTAELERAAESVNSFDWVVFTSANGVRHFFEKMAGNKIKLNEISPRIAAVGPSTASAVEQYGLKVSFIPSAYLTERLASELPKVAGSRILLVRAEGTNARMISILTRRGAIVEEIHPYRVTARKLASLPEAYDAILFTSSSTVSSFAEIIRESQTNVNQDLIVCCIGPVTAKTAEAQGLRVDVVAKEHSAEGLLKALVEKVTLR